MMDYRVEKLQQKKLIGLRMRMSFTDNRTHELWQNFITRKKEIENTFDTNLYSVQFYPPHFFDQLNPDTSFDKWAAIEVTNFKNLPENMETFILQEGLYAVFLYKGNPNNAQAPFQYIFGTWLPNSDYEVDDRPHFEILSEKYKNNIPDSEEEIWIPVKLKHKKL